MTDDGPLTKHFVTRAKEKQIGGHIGKKRPDFQQITPHFYHENIFAGLLYY